MPMLMHGQVRRPQEVRSTRKREDRWTGEETMSKWGSGDIHGVLRWPKARHRPARIFCRRPSSSTLHRLPSISMQPSGAAVASPQARAFKQASQAKQKRRRIPVEKTWTFARPDDQWAIWQGLIGEGRREVVGWEESGRLCLGEARRKWRGWSVRPLQRRQGQQRLPTPRTAAIFIMISRACESPSPLEEEWRLDHTNLKAGAIPSHASAHTVASAEASSVRVPFVGSASSRSHHHRRQQTRHQFIHMGTKTPYYP
jgi:hypothetical protein